MKRLFVTVVALALLLAGCGSGEAQQLARGAMDAVRDRGTAVFDLTLSHRPAGDYPYNVNDLLYTVEGTVEVSGALTADMRARLTLDSYTQTTYDTEAGSGNGNRSNRFLNGPALGYYADGVFYYDMGMGLYYKDVTGFALVRSLAALDVPAGSVRNLQIRGGDGFTGFENTVVSFEVVNGSELAGQINAFFGTLYPEQTGTLSGITCSVVLDPGGLPQRVEAAYTNLFANNAEYNLTLDNFRYGGAVEISAPANLVSYESR